MNSREFWEQPTAQLPDRSIFQPFQISVDAFSLTKSIYSKQLYRHTQRYKMDLFGEGTNLESIQTMGIVNSLKTGNVIIDLVFAMLIPIIIGIVLNFVSKLQQFFQKIEWSSVFGFQKEYHERRIQLSTLTSSYRTTDLGSGDAQNDLLIKAIQLYLDHNGILNLKDAKLELQQIGQDDDISNNSYYYGYDYDRMKRNTLADTLSNYKVVKKPIHNVWLEIGKYGKDGNKHNVFFMVQENMEDIKNNESVQQKRDLTLYFRSEGEQSIDLFIEHAYKWYLGQLRSLEDNSRYLYELKTSSIKDDENDNSDRRYKRYKLSEEKTFESLFFKEKDSLLKIMDNFINRKGKYAIKGYPHKLGLLLHGPPGTGKTSLIKALAQFTGRSIVNVPLARITSNAELASLFYDHDFMIEGERVPVNLNFDDVIYVMEDVDALSKVVRRRDGKTLQDMASPDGFHDLNSSPRNMWSMILSSTNEHCQELVALLMEKSQRLHDAACDPSNLCLAARKISSISGLRFVGEDVENSASSKIASSAIKCAQKQMEQQESVDEFLGMYAKSLVNMLEHGIEITEEFENHLLGLSSDDTCFSSSYASLQSSSLSSLHIPQVEDYIPQSPHSAIESFNGDHNEYDNHEKGQKPDLKAKLMESGAEFSPGCENEKGLFGMGPNSMSLWKSKRDELNLSGILNVLDGVVDTPGRIVIMTTNHPEILDPALIRPGRIDKMLLLGYLECEDLIKMLEHYFQVEVEECLISKLKEAVSGPNAIKLTPAQVEQMACEYDEIEDIVSAIESMKARNGKL